MQKFYFGFVDDRMKDGSTNEAGEFNFQMRL